MKKLILLMTLFTCTLSYAQSDVTFNVDMNCYGSDFTTVFITGPFTNWCGDCFPLEDIDGDGVWTATYSFPDGDLEYKYEVDNWAFQEDLVDDMVGGGTCAPVTDFFSYANRVVAVNGATSTTDVYGQCTECVQGAGCTNAEAINYDASATMDDGSCLFNVSFNVNMNCYDSTFTTVYVTGPFTSWCGNCFPLTDDDMDGIWTGDYAFSEGEYEYIYELDNWATQENLVEDMVNGGTCAPITDFATFANRTITVAGAVTTNETYDSCESCGGMDIEGCTDPLAINYNPAATIDDGSCQFDTTLGPINFEPDGEGADYTWTVFENDDNPALEIIANPDASGANTSATVASFTARMTGQPFAGVESMHGADIGTFTLDATTSQIRMMVWKSTISNVGIKLVESNNAALPEILVPNTVVNQWEELVFDFSAMEGIEYDQIVVFPDFTDGPRMQENVVYFDNISFNENTLMPVSGCTNPEATNYDQTATEDDGSCLYIVAFSVNMNCDSVDFNTVYVTGPFVNWCGDCIPLSDDDLDGIWTGTYESIAQDLEYKYAVDNFASQEDLIDDMVNGADCAPITDFSTFANRLVTVDGPLSLNDSYGSCIACGGDSGCTDPEALNYNPTATIDDESCVYEVIFSVDMNCETTDFTTVYVTGTFTDWCGDCFPLSDDDMDGIWVGTYPSALGTWEYKYEVDNWASQEDLIDDMVAGATCAPVTDFSTFANREITVTAPISTFDTYGSCDACVINVDCPDPGAIICDNFDDYTAGPMNGQGIHWSTWSGDLGGAEDGIVSSNVAFSNSQSLLIAEGSVQDVLLLLGNQTTGSWTASWMQFVPDSATAYYNIQESETPGEAWNMDVFFNENGDTPGMGSVTQNSATFAYPVGEWFEVSQTISLAGNTLTLSIDGVEIFNDLDYQGNLGAINFFSAGAMNRYYIDDLIFNGTPVSVEELEAYPLDVYPNPSEGIFNISSERVLDQIIVHDILGNVVYNNATKINGVQELDFTNLKKGMYLMTIYSANQQMTKKLILQ